MRTQPTRGGWLEVVCGSMFSGKSEELLRRLTRAQIANQHVKVFKPSIDNRYHETKVVSHSGREMEAASCVTSDDILTHMDDVEVVGIDEVQFFDEAIIQVIEELVSSGIRVIVSGLDQDFRGEPFGVMPQLLARAEFVDKLQAICIQCGGVATRTQRLIDGKPASADAPLIMVGAAESYEARCRNCHRLG